MSGGMLLLQAATACEMADMMGSHLVQVISLQQALLAQDGRPRSDRAPALRMA